CARQFITTVVGPIGAMDYW
nr:immunoglobulin heavy chain junction region [Mus musculus]